MKQLYVFELFDAPIPRSEVEQFMADKEVRNDSYERYYMNEPEEYPHLDRWIKSQLCEIEDECPDTVLISVSW